MILRLIGIKIRAALGGLRSDQEWQVRAPLFFWAEHPLLDHALPRRRLARLRGRRYRTGRRAARPEAAEHRVSDLFGAARLLEYRHGLHDLLSGRRPAIFDVQAGPEGRSIQLALYRVAGAVIWIVLLFGMPIFIASGVGVGAPWRYYVGLVGVLMPFVAIPTAIATLVALGITNVLRASRTRDAMLLLASSDLRCYSSSSARCARSASSTRRASSRSARCSSCSRRRRVHICPSDWCLNVSSPCSSAAAAPTGGHLASSLARPSPSISSPPGSIALVFSWLLKGPGRAARSQRRHPRFATGFMQRATELSGDLDEHLDEARGEGKRGVSSLASSSRRTTRSFCATPASGHSCWSSSPS